MVREWLNTIVKTSPIAQVKWIDEISKLGREKQKQFLRYFIHLLQQALRIRIQATSLNKSLDLTNNIPEKDQDFAARLNKMCSLEAQEAIINELNKAAYYIERNAHAKMLFHALTIRLYHIIKDNSLILIN
jgi:DNA polymerase-3 subunit delta'